MKKHWDENEEEFDLTKLMADFAQSQSTGSQLFLKEDEFECLMLHFEESREFKNAFAVIEQALKLFPFNTYFLTNKADLLIEFKKYAQALKVLDSAEACDPTDLNIHLLRSDIFLEEDHPDQALEVLDAAYTDADLESREIILLEKADIFEFTKKYDAAYDCIAELLLSNAEHVEAQQRIYLLTQITGKFSNSKNLHEQLIEKNPYGHLLWLNLGNALFHQGWLQESFDAYSYAIAIEEDYQLAYIESGDVLVAMRRFAEAIDYFQNALKFGKPECDLYFSIGYCYEKLHLFGEAREQYLNALYIDPTVDPAHFRIGMLHEMQSNFREALVSYRKAFRINSTIPAYLIAASKMQFLLNDLSGLHSTAKQLVEFPFEVKTKDVLTVAGFLCASGMWVQAEELIQRGMETSGKRAEWFYAIAGIHFSLGRRAEGMEKLRHGLQLNPRRKKFLFDIYPDALSDSDIMRMIKQYGELL